MVHKSVALLLLALLAVVIAQQGAQDLAAQNAQAQPATQQAVLMSQAAQVGPAKTAAQGISRPNVPFRHDRTTFDPATRSRNLRRSLTDSVRSIQSLRGNLEFVLQSLDTLQNTKDVSQIFNLFENIGASFDEQSTLLRVLQRNLLTARTSVRHAQRQATTAIINATAVPRDSNFSLIQEAFGRLAPEQQTSALRFQVALRFGNMDELRTKLASATNKTATTFTTFRPRNFDNRPFGNNKPGFGLGLNKPSTGNRPNLPVFNGNLPNVRPYDNNGAGRPNRPTDLPNRPNNNGNVVPVRPANGNLPNVRPSNNGNDVVPVRPANGNLPNVRPSNNNVVVNRPNRPADLPNRPIFPNRGRGNGDNSKTASTNNGAQQNVAANPVAASSVAAPVVASPVAASPVAVASPVVSVAANPVVVATAVGEESDAFVAQEEEFVTDAAITDVAAEDEGFVVDAAFADEFAADAAFADEFATDAAFVDEFALDAAVSDELADESVAFAVDDEFVDYAVAADASTAPTQTSASAIPAWGIALIVVGVLVLLGVVLVFVQLIRLLRA